MVQKTEDNKTALIIIDIQNDYFPGGTMELASADDTAKQRTYCLILEKKKCLLSTCNTSHFKKEHFLLPNTEVEIHKSMTPLKTEKVITKNFPNSFREQNY
jgi:nicotinamidase-related amidase